MKKQGTETPPEKAADACSWLEPGRVYRTGDLAAWSTNAPRLARHLVEQGALVPLAHGLFVHPRRGRFGLVPPVDKEVISLAILRTLVVEILPHRGARRTRPLRPGAARLRPGAAIRSGARIHASDEEQGVEPPEQIPREAVDHDGVITDPRSSSG